MITVHPLSDFRLLNLWATTNAEESRRPIMIIALYNGLSHRNLITKVVYGMKPVGPMAIVLSRFQTLWEGEGLTCLVGKRHSSTQKFVGAEI